MDFFFGPLEWDGVLIPAGDKGFNGIDQHFDAGKAGALKCAAAQNAKPVSGGDLMGDSNSGHSGNRESGRELSASAY